MESLLQILILQIGIFSENGIFVGIGGQEFKHTANSDSHAANTRFAATLAGFNRYPVKRLNKLHALSVEHTAAYVASIRPSFRGLGSFAFTTKLG